MNRNNNSINWKRLNVESVLEMKKIYGDNMKLIRIDTDSFHLIFYNVDIYGDIAKSLQHKKELIEKHGNKSGEVLDTYFLLHHHPHPGDYQRYEFLLHLFHRGYVHMEQEQQQQHEQEHLEQQAGTGGAIAGAGTGAGAGEPGASGAGAATPTTTSPAPGSAIEIDGATLEE